MELRPLPKKVGDALSVTALVLTSPVWGVLIAALWLSDKLSPRIPSGDHWAAWFAWHPVTLDHGFGKTVWLEVVERQRWYGRTIYRSSEPRP